MNYWMAIGIFFLGAGSGALLSRIGALEQFRRIKDEILRYAEVPDSQNDMVGDMVSEPLIQSTESRTP